MRVISAEVMSTPSVSILEKPFVFGTSQKEGRLESYRPGFFVRWNDKHFELWKMIKGRVSHDTWLPHPPSTFKQCFSGYRSLLKDFFSPDERSQLAIMFVEARLFERKENERREQKRKSGNSRHNNGRRHYRNHLVAK
ncbi:MAG: hypothetical protein WCO12_03290 [bacterium]